MQVKYSILCMKHVVLLCFLFINPTCSKASVFSFASRSRDIHYGKHNFFCYNLHLLPGMKPVTSSSLRYIWQLCDSQDMMLERTSKSVTLGMPISCPPCRACQTQLASRSACPACQTGHAKSGNESSGRREFLEV